MTDAELQAIRELAEKATPGPWPVDLKAYGHLSHADAAFIARSREGVPDLLNDVALAQASADTWEGWCKTEMAYAARMRVNIKRLQTALSIIQDYAGDSVAELHVAQELLDDIERVASKALKPEEEQGTTPTPLAPNPPNC